jgi:murein DD-endopeptidase MepM/ murein hydrolase activator NlpD
MAPSLPSRQFAWDFIGLSDDRLAVLRGEPGAALSVSDFSCFGEPVLAPASGIVVIAVDGHRDADMATDPEPIEGDLRQAAGNHVVIDHGNEVFSCLAHLMNGSVLVGRGHSVQRGQQIGALGSSGNAFGPHVHLHFMDGPDLVSSNPLPVELDAEGTRFDPQAGQIIGP